MTRPDPLLLAIDQGSGSTRVLVFDSKQRVLAEARSPLATRIPRPDRVEHDPRDLLNGTRAALSAALRTVGRKPCVAGLTTQRSTVLLWDRATGRPLTPAVSWQDRRAAGVCRSLAAHAPKIRRVTGLFLSPHYAAPKIRWLLDRIPRGQRRAEQGDILCGTVNTFLLWHLSGKALHLTDHTQAGRMLLMDLRSLQWDEGLCDLFGIPPAMLPEIRPTVADFGTIHAGNRLLPVLASIGDQQAAAFGQGGATQGDLCLNYGTGAFALLYTGSRLVRRTGLLSNIAWSSASQRTYVLEGGVNAVGSGLQWLSTLVGLPEGLAELDRLAARARCSAPILPALAGLAAPYWDVRAEGLAARLSLTTDRAALAKGFFEGVAFLLSTVVRTAQPAGSFRRVMASGGLSAVSTLLQSQANYLGRPVVRCRVRETSAWGAAALAGVGAGVWKSVTEVARLAKSDRVFKPELSRLAVSRRIRWWDVLVRASRELGAYTEVSQSE
ncbi:MAG: FGGY family carbohydrate kinase [Nitrospirota bacterium]